MAAIDWALAWIPTEGKRANKKAITIKDISLANSVSFRLYTTLGQGHGVSLAKYEPELLAA